MLNEAQVTRIPTVISRISAIVVHGENPNSRRHLWMARSIAHLRQQAGHRSPHVDRLGPPHRWQRGASGGGSGRLELGCWPVIVVGGNYELCDLGSLAPALVRRAHSILDLIFLPRGPQEPWSARR